MFGIPLTIRCNTWKMFRKSKKRLYDSSKVLRCFWKRLRNSKRIRKLTETVLIWLTKCQEINWQSREMHRKCPEIFWQFQEIPIFFSEILRNVYEMHRKSSEIYSTFKNFRESVRNNIKRQVFLFCFWKCWEIHWQSHEIHKNVRKPIDNPMKSIEDV